MAFSLPSSGFDFESSLSPSEKIDAAKYFAGSGASDATLWEKASDLNLPLEQTFGPDAPDLAGALGLDSSLFGGGLAASTQPGWTFITAPEDVSWDVANQASRVDIFGTNNPPVIAGSRGMRDLTLSNALVEGFVRGIAIEGKVTALEKLMEYGLNTSDGFVSVPVYQVWANSKSYGGPEAYYIIKDVRVKEKMRDIKGNATRAYVDVSFMQVPAYQVNTGRDQASQATSGNAAISPTAQAQAAQAGSPQAAAAAQANQGVGSQAKPAAGAASAQPASPSGFQGGSALPGQAVKIQQRPG